MNENYLNELEQLLSRNEVYTVEKKLNKNKVAELAHKYDPELIDLLAGNAGMRRLFFVETASKALVFNKDKFIQFISNKEFLPDSYTSYKNKIGLGTGTDLLAENKEIVLNWPYKDCVLEGGQDKEDAKREEVFFNEVLAPDQIDRLLDEKVLTGWKRYDKDGEHEVKDITDTDNLIIRGNNLLALHSLKRRYSGKVKLIYIDPPYNTGGDSFGYNDSFNHSSWLTFMRNRLTVARELLSDDGSIFISADGNEYAYLTVLMDEIFKRDNLLETFHFQVRYANKSLNERDDFQPVIEYGLAYAKNKPRFQPNKPTEQYKFEKFNLDVKELKEADRTFMLKDGRQVDVFLPKSFSIKKVADDQTANLEYFKETWITGSIYSDTGHGTMYQKAVEPNVSVDGLGVLYKIHGLGEDGLGFRYMSGPKKESANFGKMYAKIPLSKKEAILAGEYEKPVPIVNYYDISPDVGNIRHEGAVRFNKGKKPEKMISMLLNLFSNAGDLVLDYHLGSGTTAAVAHKMGRQYIGVEQLDYGKNDVVARLENVIKGDITGISKDVDWKGGGSFVYTHLMDLGNKFIDKVKKANTDKELEDLLAQASKSSFLSYKVDPAKINPADHDFATLSLAHKKQLLLELVDQNHLYVNYAEIDDADYGVSANDKKLNKQFYEK
jgi:adenine-specific DNA-methyltransferase